MINRLLIGFLMCAMAGPLLAQNSFSEEKPVFYQQTLRSLRALGTEAANKVAFDYENAWNSNFTSAQQDKIHSIALQMDRKSYGFKPDFWYFFSYLAYSISQAELTSDQLTTLLNINDQVVKTMEKGEYRNFLLGLNIFMARRLLVRTKNVTTISDGGSFSFKMIDEYIAPVEEEIVEEEEIIEEPEPAQPAEDPWAQDTADDPWADSDDSWGDPWADSGDSWGDTSDSWDDGSSQDDPWGESEEETEPAPQRQIVRGYKENYVKEVENKYQHPVVEGPIIDLLNNSLLIVTHYDSFKIKETTGSFLLSNRVYAGKKATINWPAQHRDFKGAVVNLDKFYIGKDRSDFWTPNAKLTHPSLFSGSVSGVFEFKSQKRGRGNPGYYPIFRSKQGGVTLNIPGEKLKYTGGIELVGNELYGTAISRAKGKLEILDGRGNKVIVRAERFHFKDSTVSTEKGSFVIKHGIDSIFHESVAMTYDSRDHTLQVLRDGKFSTRPFNSTYFKMNINAQTIDWDMNTDSLQFSILNGKDLIPVTIESDRYYNDIRFRKLSSGFNFHPVITSVYYANIYGIKSFNVDELVNEFKMTRAQAAGAMKVLAQYGFADFDPVSGQVDLRSKAFLYYDASGRRVDYDNILVPSLAPNTANASLSLDSGTLKVKGVDVFYPTSDFKVKIEPKNGNMTLLKGRHMKYDGAIQTGDFKYTGRNFEFDYDQFLINMPEVDSIKIELHQVDTTLTGEDDKLALHNELTETSGILYLDDPKDKSGTQPSGDFPYFTSDSDAIVYFDGKEVLNGAYDKSVKFLIPPFKEDSLSVDEAISFEGTFASGGIFPDFEETLRIQPDKSLGFVHQIPSEGYHLYGTAAKTYEKIYLSNDGIRGGGKIDFLSSTIYSDDFVYYPDSVAAFGRGGSIGPGTINNASYPEAVLGPFRMHWKPRVDSMYLQNLYEPFKFYNATAELDGEVNITSQGVFGSGVMNTRGSVAESDNLTFKEFSYSARHAKFEVLTDNPEKPAMAGDDISVNFDLKRNVADVHPEQAGVAAISFPYAQMKTSITNAVWDLEDSIVTMTKPPKVPIKDSYFYTTRKELDSLVFNAEQAVYDFNTKELNIRGIPYIKVADAEIIPEGHETTILENSELQTFGNAELKIDTANEYHYFHSGVIKIISRKEFVGSAMYQLTTSGKNFDIRFEEFHLDNVYITEKKSRQMTVSSGEVLPKENVLIAPGFYYKGKVKMYGYKKPLDLEGFVKLDLSAPNYDYWIRHERTGEENNININVENSVYEDEDPVIAGLHYDLRGAVYASFVEKRKAPSDEDFFLAKGQLTFDTLNKSYKIEAPAKSSGESYQGYTMIYSDETKDIVFEGSANFFSSYAKRVTLKSSILGTGNQESGEFKIDAFLVFDFFNSESFMALMAKDLVDIIERLGPPLANDNSLELMYKLANMTSDETTKKYEKASLKDYVPLNEISDVFNKSLVISGVKMNWSQPHKSWYNTTKIGISNIYGTDVNAKLDGFIEIKKDDSNNDVLNMFVQAAPGTWYFISYASNTLLLYSSDSDFNLEVNAKSNYGKSKPGELVLVGGDENETLGFINAFRERYFGITEPYNLVYPDDFNIEEDQGFETIEDDEPKEGDDGFGF